MKLFDIKFNTIPVRKWLNEHRCHRKRQFSAYDEENHGIVCVKCLDCNQLFILDEIGGLR